MRPIAHVEIPAGDRLQSAKFFHDAFGWDYENLEQMHYTVFHSENIRGGYPNFDDQHKRDDVIVYVKSDDVEADLKLIEKLGGKALSGKIEIPGRGSFAYFADPAGNRLGLWDMKQE